ncbi:hypothetical protein B0G57_1205 [Trinickia symbiotica]|uniref:Uncharacterized protein n=1 Tax=Trinickia symbiotica TaxID=863227 RepID=A0A2N7WUX4_9BURK|nr:hypothetical protein [Trinickia symbiotica]PMS33200.1 hypothetical protein C0Z20_24635 [Trinickia symbiotica]PPK42213.1 hypothetical protein B0G57_1205 [Trinickia symbiotica]
MSITINHPTIVNMGDLNEVLADDHAKAILMKGVEETPAERVTRAADLDRFAVAEGNPLLQKIANVLRNVSVMDVAAIKAQVGVQ